MKKDLKPFSQVTIQKCIETVFKPLMVGMHLTLMTYSGAGKKSLIKYIIDHDTEYFTQAPKVIFFNINGREANENYAKAMQSGALFAYSKLPSGIETELIKSLELLSTNFTNFYFFQLLEQIEKHNYRIVIMLEEWELDILKNQYSTFELLETILGKISRNCSFLFFATKNIFSDEVNIKDRYHRFLQQNIVDELTFSLTEDDQRLAIESQFQNSANINNDQIATIVRLSRRDFSLLKYLCHKQKQNDKYLDKLQELAKVEEVYEYLDSKYLDNKYQRWLKMFTFKERLSLTSTPITVQSIDLLTKLKLDGENMPFLFRYFVENRLSLKTTAYTFTASESLVFDALKQNLKQILSRDRIADLLWGSKWINKYSDYTIDKVISNIRKKVEGDYKITAIKGQGFMLDKLEA